MDRPRQPVEAAHALAVALDDLGDRVAIEVGVEDGGMDITLAAHRFRVAKLFRDMRDRFDDILPGLRVGVVGGERASGSMGDSSITVAMPYRAMCLMLPGGPTLDLEIATTITLTPW